MSARAIGRERGADRAAPRFFSQHLSPRPAIVDELPTLSPDLATTRALTSILRPSLLPLAEPAARKVARKATGECTRTDQSRSARTDRTPAAEVKSPSTLHEDAKI